MAGEEKDLAIRLQLSELKTELMRIREEIATGNEAAASSEDGELDVEDHALVSLQVELDELEAQSRLRMGLITICGGALLVYFLMPKAKPKEPSDPQQIGPRPGDYRGF